MGKQIPHVAHALSNAHVGQAISSPAGAALSRTLSSESLPASGQDNTRAWGSAYGEAETRLDAPPVQPSQVKNG
jgi:hypothetical protein